MLKGDFAPLEFHLGDSSTYRSFCLQRGSRHAAAVSIAYTLDLAVYDGATSCVVKNTKAAGMAGRIRYKGSIKGWAVFQAFCLDVDTLVLSLSARDNARLVSTA